MSNYITRPVDQVGTSLIVQVQSPPAVGVALAVETILATASEVYAVVVDNTLNSAVSYLKGFDTTGAVTEGTTNPNLILKADAHTKVQYTFDTGVSLTAGLKVMITTASAKAGITSPTSDVTITYLLTPT